MPPRPADGDHESSSDAGPDTDPVPVAADEPRTEPIPAASQQGSGDDADRFAAAPAPPERPWWNEPLPPPSRPRRRRAAPAAAATTLLLAALGAGAWYVLTPDDHPAAGPPPPPAATTTTTVAPSVATPTANPAQDRLLTGIAPQYPPGACAPAPVSGPATATISCHTADPGAPATVTYVQAPDEPALPAVFDQLAHGGSVVMCPGRIMSPGPWRHNATPEKISGTLLCATTQGQIPMVAWTTDDDLLVTGIRADSAPAPTLDQLYAWWSTHS